MTQPQNQTTSHRVVEKGGDIRSSIRDLPHHLNASTVTTGFIAAVFGCTGPVLVIISTALHAGYDAVQTISWIFAIYFFGGVLSIILSLRYRMPINGSWSLPAAVLLGAALPYYSINQAAGAYFMAGLIALILGVTGATDRVMKWVPMPVVMGMVAGSLVKYGINIITSFQVLPLVSGAAVTGYLLVTRVYKNVPGILGALIFGLGAAALTGSIDANSASYTFILPRLIAPEFSLDAFFSMSVPIMFLALGVNNAQAIGVLLAQGYKPPINFMTVITGLGGMLASLFGGHNVAIAGPMTAICCSEAAGRDKGGRYASSFVNGVLFIFFGIFASVAVGFINSFPKTAIEVIAGLAMVSVIIQAFEGAFSAGKRYQLGAFFALIVSMTDLTLLKISSPFWGLIAGTLICLWTKSGD